MLALQPYAWGSFSSEIGGQEQSRALNGLLDPRIKFSVGLVGAPALTPEEFARTPRRTVIGASLTVIVPTGEYNSTRLINLGFNRWAFKPEIGVWHPMGRWTLEGSAGIWFYTTNDSYFPGTAKRTQDPFVGLQAHVSYTFNSGAWIGLDGTWFSGGQTHVNEIARVRSPEQHALWRNAFASDEPRTIAQIHLQHRRSDTARCRLRYVCRSVAARHVLTLP